MLLRNFNPKQGLSNGTRMVIQRMCSHVLEVQLLAGTNVGHTVLVSKISLFLSDINIPFILKRHQFSLRLAFAMTINKAQGQIFGFLLQEPVFMHGQLALCGFSRLRPSSLLKNSEISAEEIATTIRRLPLGIASGWGYLSCEFLMVHEHIFVIALQRVYGSSQLCGDLPLSKQPPECDEIDAVERSSSSPAIVSTYLESDFDTLDRDFLVSLIFSLRLPQAFTW
ncbi:hypothetical protein LAZ67_10000766 [Cordylochernes scorpioides]|uniref:DNA helicase Pif1-like 2B domain-containing protein n=1 Tax=Cordylochernes scorpioides TaxID=51811 RepID=A0ABY6KVA6_9ARAC|nr:hypothetical protein LAZ67_10000766 [Cordylochernes scorpioides]